MGFVDQFELGDAEAQLQAFGETVIVRPYEGVPRTVQAIVDRFEPAKDDMTGQGRHPRLEVLVARSKTLGLYTVTANGTQIDVARHSGGTRETFTVLEILDSDAGFWRLRLI